MRCSGWLWFSFATWRERVVSRYPRLLSGIASRLPPWLGAVEAHHLAPLRRCCHNRRERAFRLLLMYVFGCCDGRGQRQYEVQSSIINAFNDGVSLGADVAQIFVRDEGKATEQPLRGLVFPSESSFVHCAVAIYFCSLSLWTVTAVSCLSYTPLILPNRPRCEHATDSLTMAEVSSNDMPPLTSTQWLSIGRSSHGTNYKRSSSSPTSRSATRTAPRTGVSVA